MSLYPARFTLIRAAAVAILLCGVGISLIVQFRVQDKQDGMFKEYITSESRFLSRAVEAELLSVQRELQFLSEKFLYNGVEGRSNELGDWASFIANMPGGYTIAVIADDMTVKWNYQDISTISLENILKQQKNNSSELSSGGVYSTPSLSVENAFDHYLVLQTPYVTSQTGQQLKFMMLLNPGPWLHNVVKNLNSEYSNKQYEMLIRQGNKILLESPKYSTSEFQEWISTTRISANGIKLDVSIRPTEALYRQIHQFSGNWLMLAVASAFFLAALLTYLLARSKSDSELKDEAISFLKKENKRHTDKIEFVKAKNRSMDWSHSHILRDTRQSLEDLVRLVLHLDKDKFPEHVKNQVRNVKNSAFYLLALLSQLSTFDSEDEGNGYDLTDFDIETLISGLLKIFEPMAERRNIIVHYNFIGDTATLLRSNPEVIRLLLFEQIKDILSSRTHGTLGVLVTLSPQMDKEHLLEVEITFHGDERHLRPSSAGDKFIEPRSELLNILGARFKFEGPQSWQVATVISIPVKTSNLQRPKVKLSGTEIEIPNLQILLVEDNHINQLIVKEMLTSDGHIVVVAQNGADALQKVKQAPDRFDLVLMDIQMPVMNGVDATRAIREMGISEEQLPIFAMTVNTLKSQVDKYIQAGMQNALVKPIIHGELRQSLGALIYNQKSGDKDFREVPAPVMAMLLIDEDILGTIKNLMSKEQVRTLVQTLESGMEQNFKDLKNQSISMKKKRLVAHDMRGQAANSGFVAVADLATVIEEQLNQGGYKEADVRELEEIFDRTLAVAKEYLECNSPENTTYKDT
ncbi:response regulator [Sneathiella sp. P13V-1]|uniref:response regulator n=1 Tax=Sneathiella sp. P13V-1 TaxID=2697366 RepID=UPI002AB203F4|nr:response regulator [Sneathiella sp. P13V-1]MBE7637310.1 response regulator [Sneathiella sp. P13V-1]